MAASWRAAGGARRRRPSSAPPAWRCGFWGERAAPRDHRPDVAGARLTPPRGAGGGGGGGGFPGPGPPRVGRETRPPRTENDFGGARAPRAARAVATGVLAILNAPRP